MKTLIIAVVVAGSLAGVAHASATDVQYMQAARCRGLAASENLGKLDTAAIDAFLREEGAGRALDVKTSAINKMNGAAKNAAGAQGAKKDKLLAEREGACAPYLGGAK
jgi:hypothetical protein